MLVRDVLQPAAASLAFAAIGANASLEGREKSAAIAFAVGSVMASVSLGMMKGDSLRIWRIFHHLGILLYAVPLGAFLSAWADHKAAGIVLPPLLYMVMVVLIALRESLSAIGVGARFWPRNLQLLLCLAAGCAPIFWVKLPEGNVAIKAVVAGIAFLTTAFISFYDRDATSVEGLMKQLSKVTMLVYGVAVTSLAAEIMPVRLAFIVAFVGSFLLLLVMLLKFTWKYLP